MESFNQPSGKLASIGRNKSFKDRLDPLLCTFVLTFAANIDLGQIEKFRRGSRYRHQIFIFPECLLWTTVQIPSLFV